MAIVTTEGIVLKTHALGDTSRIVTVYTRDHGLRKFVAKGARKLPSRFGYALEPLSRSRFVYYEKAVRELARNNPNRGRANHHLSSALNLNPSFIEAIELKEKLTGQVVVEADMSTIRSFVRRGILHDVRQGGGELPENRPDREPVVPEPQDALPVSADQATTRPSGPATRPTTGPTTRPGSDSGKQWVDVIE